MEDIQDNFLLASNKLNSKSKRISPKIKLLKPKKIKKKVINSSQSKSTIQKIKIMYPLSR